MAKQKSAKDQASPAGGPPSTPPPEDNVPAASPEASAPEASAPETNVPEAREEVGPAASQSEVFKTNHHALRGKNLFYGSAIGTDPMMAEVVLDQVKAFDFCCG